jgi:hypothetical protein
MVVLRERETTMGRERSSVVVSPSLVLTHIARVSEVRPKSVWREGARDAQGVNETKP